MLTGDAFVQGTDSVCVYSATVLYTTKNTTKKVKKKIKSPNIKHATSKMLDIVNTDYFANNIKYSTHSNIPWNHTGLWLWWGQARSKARARLR